MDVMFIFLMQRVFKYYGEYVAMNMNTVLEDISPSVGV